MSRPKKRYTVNFPAHLADCEFNYHRLCRLMPGWPEGTTKTKESVYAYSSSIPQSCDDVIIECRPRVKMNGTNRGQWGYIAGNGHSEIAILLNVSESAKYTTTVHIAVHTSLQNQVSWGKYLHSIAKSAKLPSSTEQISLADHRRGVTMQASSYSLGVRMYHDATVAEVIEWEGHKGIRPRHEYPNRYMYQSDEKAQLNRFLGELLEFCLTQGRILDNVL